MGLSLFREASVTGRGGRERARSETNRGGCDYRLTRWINSYVFRAEAWERSLARSARAHGDAEIASRKFHLEHGRVLRGESLERNALDDADRGRGRFRFGHLIWIGLFGVGGVGNGGVPDPDGVVGASRDEQTAAAGVIHRVHWTDVTLQVGDARRSGEIPYAHSAVVRAAGDCAPVW